MLERHALKRSVAFKRAARRVQCKREDEAQVFNKNFGDLSFENLRRQYSFNPRNE